MKRKCTSIINRIVMVQGAHSSDSGPHSLVHLGNALRDAGVEVFIFMPVSMLEEHSKKLADIKTDSFLSESDLSHKCLRLDPACILLSSHDPCFGALRRHKRAIRWTHESPKCYDPQASRCLSPLYATSAATSGSLCGFVAEARTYVPHIRSEVIYTNGVIRVVSVGDICNPRANFKAFQALAEKYPTVAFYWVGATMSKRWNNIHLKTYESACRENVINSSDLLLWCADDDPCPREAFCALWNGVEVWVFSKNNEVSLPPFPKIEGKAFITVHEVAPQHAPLHTATKNVKDTGNVNVCRQYVHDTVGHPPETLMARIHDYLNTKETSK